MKYKNTAISGDIGTGKSTLAKLLSEKLGWEYIRRNNIPTVPETDGIQRDLSDPVENARYWITYAHEAIAFQAAKNYLFGLSSEANVNRDIVIQIQALQGDIGILKGKVEKSKKALVTLLEK